MFVQRALNKACLKKCSWMTMWNLYCDPEPVLAAVSPRWLNFTQNVSIRVPKLQACSIGFLLTCPVHELADLCLFWDSILILGNGIREARLAAVSQRLPNHRQRLQSAFRGSRLVLLVCLLTLLVHELADLCLFGDSFECWGNGTQELRGWDEWEIQ